MPLCLICNQNPATASAIVQGTYYRSVCSSCKAQPNVSSGHARWERSIDAEDHEFDIMQPYGADGKPNAQFVKAYPRQSAALFSQEEMDKIIRS